MVIIIAGAGSFYALNSKSSTTTLSTQTTSSSNTSPGTSSTLSASSSTSQSVSASSSASSSSSASASSSSSSTSSAASSSSSSSTSSSGAGPFHQSLTIDDAFWQSYDLNVLVPAVTFPNWLEDDVYQPLVSIDVGAEYNNQGYHFLPGLASNWTVSSDGRTYTFNLRQGITFSNGNQFNAYQVWTQFYSYAFTFGNASIFYYYNILNQSMVKFGPATFALINQSGLTNPSPQLLSIMQNQSWPIYVTNPYQIVFHLSSPFLWLLGLLDGAPGWLFDMQWVVNHGGPGYFGQPDQQYFFQHAIPGTATIRSGELFRAELHSFCSESRPTGRKIGLRLRLVQIHCSIRGTLQR